MIDRLYRDIAGFMYLLDVLVVVVHISHRICWEYLLLHQVSVLRAGWKFLVTDFFSAKTSSWGLKTLGGGGGVSLLNFFIRDLFISINVLHGKLGT